MNCNCNITNGLLSPGVFNLKQYMNETTVMCWDVSSRYLPGSLLDLYGCDAFLVLQKGDGEIDEVFLTSTLNANNKICLTWNVGTFATWLTGYVKYQIVFRGKCLSGLNVIAEPAASHAEAGEYQIDNELSSGNGRTWTHKVNTTYKISWDATNSRWQLMNGATLVSYQTFNDTIHNDPCRGEWNGILVGNCTACVWESNEAVLYISDSVAGDIHVSAKCPTILRQMWNGLRQLVIKSGVTVLESNVATTDWTGASAPYTLDVAALVSGVSTGCTIKDVRLFEATASGFSDIGNINIQTETNTGKIYVKSLEKVAGKIMVTVKGGDGYYIPAGSTEVDTKIAAHNTAANAHSAKFDAISAQIGDIETLLDAIIGGGA